jgi:acetoin utilization deacetylase AcuC-like enzyme
MSGMTTTTRMKLFYSDTFELPLPEVHRFPIEKYRLLRERLQMSEFRDRLEFCLPLAATNEQLLLVHTAEYLDKLKHGRLSRVEQRRIGFPWSPELVERSRRSTGATIGAAQAALRDGVGVHLAGGTHHAFADHGQGYCVFNDVAVAFRVLQSEGLARRAVVIDLDVHQGNGTAAIFANDSDVFTFSMHGERNFPFAKCNGDLDISLPDGTGDEAYLAALRTALKEQLPLANSNIVFYLAGADPYEDDRFGKMKLTKAGLAERDRILFASCRHHRVPVAVVMAGGYARSVDDVVAINSATMESLVNAKAVLTHNRRW